MRQSLDIQEQVLGRDHPAVATSLNGYAMLFKRLVRITAHAYVALPGVHNIKICLYTTFFLRPNYQGRGEGYAQTVITNT